MEKISVVIITLNEEKNIERCLKSVVDIADEIFIVDSYSTDSTEDICRKYNAKFVQHKFEGYIEQKNWAASNATYDYVLSLDADEALSEELRESIRQVKNNWCADGYTFNRLTNYCGTWIKHTSWYPSRKLRLWDRRKGKWDGINPHDKFIMVKGSLGKHLKGDLLHYSYYSISGQIQQINRFTDILANAYHQRGMNATLYHIVLRPLWRFVRDYFIKLGFLDGFYGLVISINASFEVYLKYLKLKKIVENESAREPFRTSFFSGELSFSEEEQWIFYNAKKFAEKGIDTTIISNPNSEILLQRNSHIGHFSISINKYSYLNPYKVVKLVKYYKRMRVKTIIVSNINELKIAAISAKLCGIKSVIYHQNNISSIPDSRLIQFVFNSIVSNVFINSKKTMYTIILRNYKLITKEKILILDETNNLEISENLLRVIA